jgi:CO dehydrogenase/acetyl-CoA synthase epsilon subunit
LARMGKPKTTTATTATTISSQAQRPIQVPGQRHSKRSWRKIFGRLARQVYFDIAMTELVRTE